MSSVDVFVPCYRYGHFLRECVESVLSQSGVSVRVLIIDDASPDNTAEVAAALASEDRRVSIIRHIENKGHIATYNEGIEWAAADYMLLLSADDYLLPGALSRAADLMDAHPDVGFTFGNVIELSDNGIETPIQSRIGAARILSGNEFIALVSDGGNLVATCTAVVRTELQKHLGGYRFELPHAGDMEMWLSFAAHASVGFVSSYQAAYRQHSTNMSTMYYSLSQGRLSYKKNGRSGDLQQQKMAFDLFLERCNDVIPQGDARIRRLYRNLSLSAVRNASAAFNDGEMEESRQISEFALAVFPEIKRSWAWFKLTIKRWVGARIWRAMRPTAAAVRAMRRK